MVKYPKIETLFKRDENFKITDEIRLPEFENIKRWLITEKIDGTNIRVIYEPAINSYIEGRLLFRGRTDNAQIPTFLLEELQKMFTIKKIKSILKGEPTKGVCLYGEGYGAKIQKGGGNYNKGNSFRLFDVWIDGWWLEWDSVVEVAEKLGIKTVPTLPVFTSKTATMNTTEAISIIKRRAFLSEVARRENNTEILAEGIVARAYPMMLFRNGTPIKWKLKVKDYKEVKK